MSGLVSVDGQIFDKQGIKAVLFPDGHVEEVGAGQGLPPAGEVLAVAGEPAFQVRLAEPVSADEDVPDSVGLALRAVAHRLCELAPDGWEEGDWVDGFLGPMVQDGSVMLWLDTDGKGFTPGLMDAMVGVFVDELTPLSIQLEITAGPIWPGHLGPTWMSSAERHAE